MLLSEESQALVRKHLIEILSQYSDADVIILSDYIVALLAKDADPHKIRADCEGELSAFMGEKTKSFVAQLFLFLNTVLNPTQTIDNMKQEKLDPNSNLNSKPTKSKPIIIKKTIKTKNEGDAQDGQSSRIVELQSDDEQNLIVAHITNDPRERDARDIEPSKPQTVNTNTNSNLTSTMPVSKKVVTFEDRNNPRGEQGHATQMPDDLSLTFNVNRKRKHHHSRYKRTHNHNHMHRKRYRKQHQDDQSMVALTQILGILQQNPGIVQGLDNPLKLIAPRPIIKQSNPNEMEQLRIQANLQPGLKPRIIMSQPQSQPRRPRKQHQPFVTPLQRLPPANDPFYQDNRFDSVDSVPTRHPLPRNTLGPLNERRRLYLSQVPPSLNTVPALSSHFQQFGDLVHVNVNRHRNQAFIQFRSHSEAYEALNDPQPVLFDQNIQVAWAYQQQPRKPRSANSKFNGNQPEDAKMKLGSAYFEGKVNANAKPVSLTQAQCVWVSDEYKQKLDQQAAEVLPPQPDPSKYTFVAQPPLKKAKHNTGKAAPVVTSVSAPRSANSATAAITKLQGSMQKCIQVYESATKKLETTSAPDEVASLKDIQRRVVKKCKEFEALLKQRVESQKKQLRNERQLRQMNDMQEGAPHYSEYSWCADDYNQQNRAAKTNPYFASSYFNKRNQESKKKLDAMSSDYRTCVLQVTSLPVDELQISAHLKQFGELVSVEMDAVNKRCLVKYGDRRSAETALKSGATISYCGVDGVDTTSQLKIKFVEDGFED